MSTASAAWTQRDSARDFHALFDNSPLAWAHCDRGGAVIATNPALESAVAPSGELKPRTLNHLIRSTDDPETRRLVREMLDGTRAGFQVDAATAEGIPVRWTAWQVRELDGAPQSILAVAQHPASEHGDHRADRLEAVGRLAGGVAHDFNNLLTGVLLYCDLLMATIEPGHRARKYAEEIRKAGVQASGLVRQLLMVARPATFQPRLLSLNEIVEGMRDLLVRLIGENRQLKYELDPKLGAVKMDPTQAQQILLNLVLNARDAMPRGGEITVETRNCRLDVLANGSSASSACLPCALFRVSDTGLGMDDSTRAHMFEPFFTTKGKGTGLGLATVHDIVTSNGGLIHVESELDHGTRINVLLPLAVETLDQSLAAHRNSSPEIFQEISTQQEEE